MKSKLLLFLSVLVSTVVLAQTNGINYKAIVKDNTGTIVANTLIQVEFAILQGVGLTNVYSEGHIPTTDANGIIILNIGGGTLISGVYATIDWGSDDYFLNVKMNTGAGLTDMGTTQFLAVPYAKYAETAALAEQALTADVATQALNANGLEPLDEGSGIGWRLVGRDPNNYGPIGEGAIDLSTSQNTGSIYGATGEKSMALGSEVEATGISSFAGGSGSEASGSVSFAFGTQTNAKASYSSAFGQNSNANYYGQFVIGRLNRNNGSNLTVWNDTDPLFMIGNGVGLTSSNALVVYKNGKMDIIRKNNTGLAHLVLKGYANSAEGDNGIITSDPDLPNSDIILESNDAIVMHLDFNNSSAGEFQIKNGLDNVVFEVNESGTIFQNGATIHSSDRRLKKEITSLNYGLSEVLKLQPKSYYWKSRVSEEKSFGFIAQDVQKVVSEIVSITNEEDATLGISYTELIPVLVNAIKEQQNIIKNQNSKIEDLSSEVSELKSLENRMQEIESLLKVN